MGRKSSLAPLLALATCIVLRANGFTTFQNNNLLFTAGDLVTNGVPGITNVPQNLMVSAVATNSAQGGVVSSVNGLAWVSRFTGTSYGQNQGIKVVADDANNIIVTGYWQADDGLYLIATLKYGADGTPLWTNFYRGPTDVYARSVALDGEGNIYVGGDSDPASPVSDVVTIKYAPNGSPLWTNRFNSAATNESALIGMRVNQAGNAYLLVDTLYPATSQFLTLKYDPSGNPVWTNFYKAYTNGDDVPVAIAVTSDGNVFVAGTSGVLGAGLNYAVIKYAADGEALWTNRFAVPGDGIVEFMTLDQAGNCIVTGDSMPFTNHFYATVKYSANGVLLWSNMLTGPRYQGSNLPHLATDIAGNIFITGGSPGADDTNADFTILKLTADGSPIWTNRFFDSNSGNPAPAGTAVDSAGNCFLGGHSIGLNGTNIGYFTVKYSTAGVPLWTNRYYGRGNPLNWPNGIVTDHSGNVYLTGESGVIFGSSDFATVKYADYISYSPPRNFVGIDTFTFTAVDAFGNTATGVATIEVLPNSLQISTSSTNLQLTPLGLHLRVDGAQGMNPVILYASTNLVDWESISTNPAALGSAEFLDPMATNLSKRFYRAAQQQ